MKAVWMFSVCGTLFAQSLSTQTPSAGQSLSAGYITLSATCSACTTQVAAEYFVDNESVGITYAASASPPFSLQWSPFATWNGSHQVFAKAYDALGNTIATSAAVTFNTATVRPVSGWSSSAPPNVSVTIGGGCTDGGTWTGTCTVTATVNNPVSGATQGADCPGYTSPGECFKLWVDGVNVANNGSGTHSVSFSLDTTKWPNGSRKITVTAFQQGQDTAYGLWQKMENFSNGTTAMALALNRYQIYLAPGATFSLSPTILNTDGTTSTASSPAYATDVPSVCTVTSGGVITAAGNGLAYNTTGNYCHVTVASGSFSRVATVFVVLSNALAHFLKNGTTTQSYSATNSLFMHSLFTSMPMFSSDPAYGYANAATDMNLTGFNTFEADIGTVPLSTQSSFNSAQAAYVSQIQSYCSQGFYFHGIGDSFIKSNLYLMTRGAPSTWTPPAYQKLFSDAVSMGCTIGASMADEFPFGLIPLEPIPQMGVSVNSVVCTAGSCVANWPTATLTANPAFVIQGATTNTCLNNATGSNWTGSLSNYGQSNATLNFSASGCGTFTANSSTDPNLIIQPYWNYWSGSDGVRWDAFHNVSTYRATAGGPVFGWPLLAGGGAPWQLYNVEGDPNFSQFTDAYFSFNNGAYGYHPNKRPVQDFIADIGNTFRTFYATVPNNHPITMLTSGVVVDHGFQGVTCSIASISNELVTFTAPCWPANQPLYPGISRIAINGTSNSIYNTSLVIGDVLDASHVTVLLAVSTFSASVVNSGNIQFASGDTLAIWGITVSTSYPGGSIDHTPYSCTGTAGVVSPSGPTYGQILDRNRGTKFTVAGSSSAALNSGVYWWPRQNPSCVSQASQFYQVPQGSSTGGTGELITSNYFQPGRNFTAQAMYPLDLSQFFIETFYSLAQGASGQRVYGVAQDVQLASPGAGLSANAQYLTSIVGDTTTGGNYGQRFFHPFWNRDINSPLEFASSTNAQLFFSNRIAKYFLGAAHVNSPDCGTNFETFAYSSSAGNLLFVLPMNDGLESCAVNLSPYIASGQNYLKYTIAWNSLTFTTMSPSATADTTTYTGSVPVVFLFPTTYSADAPQQPVVSARLADVPNATKIVVRWAYHPLLVDQDASMIADCGTGTCTLPADRKIGTVYYRVLYLNANRNVLATSDVQTL